MKRAPYTQFQAQEIAAAFQELSGHPFAPESSYTIETVAVCPFDEQDRLKFLSVYFLTADAQLSLETEYALREFDVLVIARSANDENELMQESIHSWLATSKYVPAHEANAARILATY